MKKTQIVGSEKKIKDFIDAVKPDDWVTLIDKQSIMERHLNSFKKEEDDPSDPLYIGVREYHRKPARGHFAILLDGHIREFHEYSLADLVVYPHSSPNGRSWRADVIALLAQISVDRWEMIAKKSKRTIPNREMLRSLMYIAILETMQGKALNVGFKPFKNRLDKRLFEILLNEPSRQRILSNN